jgi:hypothetical protein
MSDITRRYHRDNPQSAAANKRANKYKYQALIVWFLKSRGWRGATCDEAIMAIDPQKHQSISPRFTELKQDEVIVPKIIWGEGRDAVPETRPTRTGSDAVVYVLAPGLEPPDHWTVEDIQKWLMSCPRRRHSA